MPRIELPNDNWAVLRDPSEVSERSRRPLMAAINRVSQETFDSLKEMSPEEVKEAVIEDVPSEAVAAKIQRINPDDLELLQGANDHCIVAMVGEWSYDKPITLDGVLDLPAAAYDKLRDECAPAIQTLFVNFAPSKDEQPDSPFGPSSESNGRSTAAPSIVDLPSPASGERIGS